VQGFNVPQNQHKSEIEYNGRQVASDGGGHPNHQYDIGIGKHKSNEFQAAKDRTGSLEHVMFPEYNNEQHGSKCEKYASSRDNKYNHTSCTQYGRIKGHAWGRISRFL
jgi:hypothetical protein